MSVHVQGRSEGESYGLRSPTIKFPLRNRKLEHAIGYTTSAFTSEAHHCQLDIRFKRPTVPAHETYNNTIGSVYSVLY